jgi:hypothetical protein
MRGVRQDDPAEPVAAAIHQSARRKARRRPEVSPRSMNPRAGGVRLMKKNAASLNRAGFAGGNFA